MIEAILNEAVLRAITDDGAFRVITLRTTDTVQKSLQTQKAEGRAARWLGELITGTILVRETMAPNYRVQGILSDVDGGARLVADSHPDGGARGLLRMPAGDRDLEPRHINRLAMMRTLMNGELHQGFVEVPEGGNISKALMTYMTVSEQVASVISVGCVMDQRRQRVAAAGGYMVQLLPEVGRESLEVMTERLGRMQDVDQLLVRAGADPAAVMNELLGKIPFTQIEKRPVCFKCRCSSLGVLASLATIGKDEIRRMIEEGKWVPVVCEYCGCEYQVMPDQLKGLLSKS